MLWIFKCYIQSQQPGSAPTTSLSSFFQLMRVFLAQPVNHRPVSITTGACLSHWLLVSFPKSQVGQSEPS